MTPAYHLRLHEPFLIKRILNAGLKEDLTLF